MELLKDASEIYREMSTVFDSIYDTTLPLTSYLVGVAVKMGCQSLGDPYL